MSVCYGKANLSVFHGFQQGTNFPVTPEEGTILGFELPVCENLR